jgi:hypothetical protein
MNCWSGAHEVVPFFNAGAAFLHLGAISYMIHLKGNDMDNGYFFTSRPGMLDELIRSADNGNALGIWSAALGSGMFLCMIREVWRDDDEDDMVVVLGENELTGAKLQTHVLYLSEIERICTFISPHVSALGIRH